MERSYLVGYELNKSGQDYKTFFEEIKKLGTWWHCLDSTWIIKADSSTAIIRDHLKKFIDNNAYYIFRRQKRHADRKPN